MLKNTSVTDWIRLLKDYTGLENNAALFSNIVFTCLLLVGAVVIRKIWLSTLSANLSIEDRRRRHVHARNSIMIATVLLMALLWAPELKSFTVSLVAIAAAIVLATKELIMSVLGGITRSTTKKYSVGDRIQIKDLQGDVVDVTLLQTTLMLLGPERNVLYTGKIAHIPHSLLLTEPVIVNPKHSYVTRTLKLPLNGTAYPLELKQLVQDKLSIIVAPFIDEATTQYHQIQNTTAIDMPSAQPKILLNCDDKNEWYMLIRLVLPQKQANSIEQDVIEFYLSANATLDKNSKER